MPAWTHADFPPAGQRLGCTSMATVRAARVSDEHGPDTRPRADAENARGVLCMRRSSLVIGSAPGLHGLALRVGHMRGTTFTTTVATWTFLLPPGTPVRFGSTSLAPTVQIPPGGSMFIPSIQVEYVPGTAPVG